MPPSRSLCVHLSLGVLRPLLKPLVEDHDDDVPAVADDHGQALVPEDLLVDEDDDQHDHGQAVDQAVTGDRVPSVRK